MFVLVVAIAAGGLAPAARQATPDARVRRVLDSPQFKDAAAFLDRTHDRMTDETIRLTEIPAPPFKEARRGKAFADLLRQTGLTAVETDPAGNVMGIRKGAGGPLVAIAAHLDTVFPEGTDVHVKQQGTRLAAPGVGDDTRSLAVLLAMIRALDAARIQTKNDILFVGDVGEEGQGDLRGMRYLFQKGAYKDRIKAFISIDGTGQGNDITNGAVGSKRYRVTFKGPGGHSYGAFGLVSPSLAMGNAIQKISKLAVPASPKTTFNVGMVGGGTSVNSIPFESWMELDLRSESAAELAKLDKSVNALVTQAVDEENRTRSTMQGRIVVEMKLIGDRPSGETPRTSPLVQTAAAVITAMGWMPQYNISSTDSNIPISLGIPAITLDSGARGGREHALDEWIDVEKSSSLPGLRSILAILLTVADVSLPRQREPTKTNSSRSYGQSVG
jgi:acetylornithine deacetylase/succinyl-diaminopimelate desuccinylase-like protein